MTEYIFLRVRLTPEPAAQFPTLQLPGPAQI